MQPKITGKDIQGVPKIGALSELSFCKPGLRARGLPLLVACSTGSGKPITLKPCFAKLQFRKCVFLGHPVYILTVAPQSAFQVLCWVIRRGGLSDNYKNCGNRRAVKQLRWLDLFWHSRSKMQIRPLQLTFQDQNLGQVCNRDNSKPKIDALWSNIFYPISRVTPCNCLRNPEHPVMGKNL